ncbi:MAG TPA: glycosyltransferase family A protein [Stellaceae bacterium]|nr:glycosyltransferase family A protein [Stellaceae bacterium]
MGSQARSHGLISVIIPTYNRAGRVMRAIESAVGQTYADLEIIVADDGSTDGTPDLLRDFSCARPFRFLESNANRGAPAARNRALGFCEGRWVAFLDSDDVWHPRKLERQIEKLTASGAEFRACYTGLADYDDAGRLCGVSRATDHGDIRGGLMTHNLVGSTSSVLVERDLLRDVGGFAPGLRSCQDWELWIRLAQRTKFACVPEILTVISAASTGRVTTDGRSRLSGHLYMYRTHLRQHFKAGTADPALFRAILGRIFIQLDRPRYAARVFHMNWRAKRHSLKRLMLCAMAYAHVGNRQFFRTEALLQRLERRLRPPRVHPPLDPASFSG